MNEVLRLAFSHGVFTLPWPSWLDAREATAKASRAEARRSVMGGQRFWGETFTDGSPSPILKMYSELFWSFRFHALGANGLL